MTEAIKLAVRVRPLRAEELAANGSSAVQVDRFEGLTVTVKANPAQAFSSDFAYYYPERSPSASSREVSSGVPSPRGKVPCEAAFADIGQAMVRDALNGYDSCVIAYGQGGSGRSTAILGTGGRPGLAPQCITELVGRRAGLEVDPGAQLHVRLSCAQVHNDQIRDLLCAHAQVHNLEVIDHPKAGPCIPNLTEAVCHTRDDVQRLLGYARKRLALATSSQLRATSAHSHTLVSVIVERVVGSRPRSDGAQQGQVLRAKLLFVDLAGSEVISSGGVPRPTQDPGLSVLGRVAELLGEGRPGTVKRSWATFRESTLTVLLRDALVGRSRTYLMACISPLERDVQASLTTLQFAEHIRRLRTSPGQNRGSGSEVLELLHAEAAKLRHQVVHERPGRDEGACRELARTELLLGHLSISHDAHEENSRLLEEEQQEALVRGGLLQGDCGEATPFLMNMSHDALLEGCLVHHLPKNHPTTIGAAEGNSVPVRGLAVPPQLCKITNRGNSELHIMKVAPGGRLSVNGRLMAEGEVQKLRHGDKVYIGRAYAVRVSVPMEESNRGGELGLSLQGLEEEWSAVCGSPLWESLREYLNQVKEQMRPAHAERLFEEMRCACQLVEEANELTAECRPEENLHFEVDLTSAVPSSVVVRVLRQEDASGVDESAEDELAGTVLYLWSLPVMTGRLQQMRQLHALLLGGDKRPVDPLQDPWHEPQPGALAQRLGELERALARERDAHAQQRRLRLAAGRRQLERHSFWEEAACLRELLSAWRAVRKGGQSQKPREATRQPPNRPLSPPKTASKAIDPLPSRESQPSPPDQRHKSPERRRHVGSFDFNYRGGFKAGCVQPARAPRAMSPRAATPTPVAARSSSVGRRAQRPQQQHTVAAATVARKPQVPPAPKPREDPEKVKVAAPNSPCETLGEQPSFVSSDGRSTTVDEEHSQVAQGELDTQTDSGGTVSRFVSGIVTASTVDGEGVSRVVEAYETRLLRRQLEQAWQLGHALRSNLPDQEQPNGCSLEEPLMQERSVPPVVVPPLSEWQLQQQKQQQQQQQLQQQPQPGFQPQAPANVQILGHPWQQPGVLSPRYTPECPPSGSLEGLSTLPRCVVIHTTAALVPSRP